MTSIFTQLFCLCGVSVLPAHARTYARVQQIEKLTTLTQYFGVWKPPPTNNRLDYVQHTFLPKIK